MARATDKAAPPSLIIWDQSPQKKKNTMPGRRQLLAKINLEPDQQDGRGATTNKQKNNYLWACKQFD